MGTQVPMTTLVVHPFILTGTERKAATNSKFQSGREPRELEDWLEVQPQRFVLLGITFDSYDAEIWVTSQLFRTLNKWWLNRKQHVAMSATFDLLVEELRKTSICSLTFKTTQLMHCLYYAR
jgi:hypothetical protein